jgi:Base plate wedge protein 53
MTQYFSKFPGAYYDIDGTNTNVRYICDIIHRAKFLEILLNNVIIFYPYVIKDGETPEIIADKLYGTSQFHWIVLYANNIFSLWDDWPLSYDQMQSFLSEKYGSVPTAETTLDHYQDKYGATIDYDSYLQTYHDGSIIVYADQAAIAANDIKKQIRLVDPSYVAQIDNELNKLMIPVV